MRQCEKNKDGKTNFSHIKSKLIFKAEVSSRINDNFTDKKYTYISLECDQVNGFAKRTMDGITQFFHRFKHKCVFFEKITHETHGTTFSFTLSDNFKNQCEEINEANDMSKKIF